MEGGGGGIGEDGVTPATTAEAPRADSRPFSQTRMGDALQVRPGVALRLRPSVEQVRWQLVQQQLQQQQRLG